MAHICWGESLAIGSDYKETEKGHSTQWDSMGSHLSAIATNVKICLNITKGLMCGSWVQQSDGSLRSFPLSKTYVFLKDYNCRGKAGDWTGGPILEVVELVKLPWAVVSGTQNRIEE